MRLLMQSRDLKLIKRRFVERLVDATWLGWADLRVVDRLVVQEV
jgi:hypothetical protein